MHAWETKPHNVDRRWMAEVNSRRVVACGAEAARDQNLPARTSHGIPRKGQPVDQFGPTRCEEGAIM